MRLRHQAMWLVLLILGGLIACGIVYNWTALDRYTPTAPTFGQLETIPLETP